MIMKKIITIIIVAGSIIIVPFHAHAAQIFFGVQNKSVATGQKIQVGVFIDSTHESINAIESTVTFPADAFAVDGFYTGNSVLLFWIQQPTQTVPGVVSFSGIIPGGFAGNKGYLFSLILTAKKTGAFSITSSHDKVLLNDGKGTQTTTVSAPLKVTVTKDAPATFAPLADTAPPELFFPAVSNDQHVFGGKYFIAFAAQDKGMGVDRYEVMEKSLFGKGDWISAQSPYLLHDQALLSTIYVKAVDKAGNEQVAIIKAPHMLLYAISFAFGIIVLVVVIFIACLVWKKIMGKRHGRA
jgi:hypothetical protein